MTGSAALRALRRSADLTQEQLAELSSLSVRTIRGLEIGNVASPHQRSLEQIAAALELDAFEQSRFLRAWHRREFAPARYGGRDRPLGSGVVGDFVEKSRTDCVLVSLHETVTVGATRTIDSIRTDEVIVATRDGVDHRQVLYDPEEPRVVLDRLQLHRLHNCSITSSVVDHQRGVAIVDLKLSRTLRRGESLVISYTVDYRGARPRQSTSDSGEPAQQYMGGFFRPPLSYVLEVQFDVRRCSPSFVQVAQAYPTSVVREVRRLGAPEPAQAHLVLLKPKPGGHGVRWTW